MKKIFSSVLALLIMGGSTLAQRIIMNPPYLGGTILKKSAFNGNSGDASITDVEASNQISSWNLLNSNRLTQTAQLVVDKNNASTSMPMVNPVVGNATWSNSLTFGNNSGEGITSKRNMGPGVYGLDFFTGYRNRLHVGRDGSVGAGTNTGASPATAAGFSRFHIHNFQNGEEGFYKSVNLYTTAAYSGTDYRVGIGNMLSNNGAFSNPAVAVGEFWQDMEWKYPRPTYPFINTAGIVNSLRRLSAPLPADRLAQMHVYGIYNDLNDKRVAFTEVLIPPYTIRQYAPRTGILSVTNTNFNSNDKLDMGAGKMAAWLVNYEGRTPPPAPGSPDPNIYATYDGWALWADGATMLQSHYWTQSDENLKTSISKLNNAEILKKITALSPSRYIYKNDPDFAEYGFLAQELGTQFPEMVAKAVNPNAPKSAALAVQYGQLHAVTISAIQAQQELIIRLQKEVEMLKRHLKLPQQADGSSTGQKD